MNFLFGGKNNSKTFKPRKHIPDNSNQQDLLEKASITLGSGNLRLAVKLPEGEDLNERIAVNNDDKYPPIVVEEDPEPCLNYDVNKPRLMIDKLVVENFKSYAGVRTLGPFHKNLTCIIGPNGSGKSNVIDSLLFVFGFRTLKIRSKNLSALIHKSQYFPNVISCSVRVFFKRIKPTGDGDEDYEVIENSEFNVTRTAFKDNKSIYKINDNEVDHKDVKEFLKNQGIDFDHNRFLILQGEVEQIALMKPKATTEYEDGLLEYLDDIIGSHRFKEPITTLSKDLEKLCELRTEKFNLFKAVRIQKGNFEGDRNEAVKYLRLCNEITIRKNISFQLKQRELNLLEASAVENQNEIKQKLDQIKAVIDQINKQRPERVKEQKSTVKQYLMKTEQFDDCKKQFSALEFEDTKLRNQHKQSKMKLDELVKTIKLKEKEIVKYENVPDESMPRITQLNGEIEKLEEIKQKEIKNQEKAQATVNEKTKDLKSEKDTKIAKMRKQQDLLNKQEMEIAMKKCELDCLVERYQKEEESYFAKESKQKSTKEKIEKNKEELKNLSEQVPKMNEEYNATVEEIKTLKTSQAKITKEIDQLRSKLHSVQSEKTGHRIINFLLEQQRLGKLKGIVGRLGNLGSVDPKYDVAISTACGRLDSIVTATIDDAQRCVELMKANNIGTAEFLAMDKIRHWGTQADQSFPPIPGAPRAFDIISIPNPELRSVFYFALKDLLISQDTRESCRINKGHAKYRIVTLKVRAGASSDWLATVQLFLFNSCLFLLIFYCALLLCTVSQGNITSTDGSITGGGNYTTSGKICTDPSKVHDSGAQGASSESTVNMGDSAATEKLISEKEMKLNEILGRVEHLTKNSEQLRFRITAAMDRQKMCQGSLKCLCVDESKTAKTLQLLQTKLVKIKPDPKEVEKIEAQIAQLQTKFDTDSQSVKQVQGEIDKVSDDIKSIAAACMSAVNSRLSATQDKIKEKADMLKKIELSMKNAEKILKRTLATLGQLKNDKESQENHLKDMDTALKDLEQQAEETQQVYEETNTEVGELMAVKEEHSVALSKIDDDLKNSKHKMVQMNRDFEEKKSKVDKIKDRVRVNKGQLEKLTFHPLPEGVEEDLDYSFMELIGESSDSANVFSSQKDCHIGSKLKVYSDDELQALRVHQITYLDMEDKLQQLKPNMSAIENYQIIEERYMERAVELVEVTEKQDSKREGLEKLKRQRNHEFMAGFDPIARKLKKMYQIISMGGDAELELVDSLDPFSEGIQFSVRPPKKSWKNISNLSGGEKTLSSLALVFALHHFKPTPFYVMDEIDASLDFKNVSIVANYMKELTKNAQFIVVSLRINMYELADRLVGIYKPFNFSKTVVVNPKALENCLRATRKTPDQPVVLEPVTEIAVDLDESPKETDVSADVDKENAEHQIED